MALGLKYLPPEKRMEIGAELKKKPKEELEKFLKELTPEERDELLYDWAVWLRPSQYVPVGMNGKDEHVVMCGRG